MNNYTHRNEVNTLREEINQELHGYEKLLALRCLNFGYETQLTPASELLHVILHTPSSHLHAEYLRFALPTILPVATYLEKVEIATRLIHAYANESYGHALLSLFWSCLDTSEHATMEASQVMERLGKVTNTSKQGSILHELLQVLTGSHLYQFLEFCIKVSHVNTRVQRLIVSHLMVYQTHAACYRICATLSSFNKMEEWMEDMKSFPSEFWTCYYTLFPSIQERIQRN